MFSSLLLVGVFSGLFFVSLSPKHLKFWIESYLNKPSARFNFEFKDINLSLSQWGVLPIVGLKSSLVNIKVKPFKKLCFDVDSLRLNDVLIKINPFDLLFGKLYFNSLQIKKVQANINSFCQDFSINTVSKSLSTFIQNKVKNEITNFSQWIHQINVDSFFFNTQYGKRLLIKDLSLEANKGSYLLLLSGDIFPYLKQSFSTIKSIQSRIFIDPKGIKANWWWHLHEGVIELNSHLYLLKPQFTQKKALAKTQNKLKLELSGQISYLPLSSSFELLHKLGITKIKLPELNTWLSCLFDARLDSKGIKNIFFNTKIKIKNCKLNGPELKATLTNSQWSFNFKKGLKSLRPKQKTDLYFSKLSFAKLINPLLASWAQTSNHFSNLNFKINNGNLLGVVSIFKNRNWEFFSKTKDMVLSFKKEKRLEWFSAPDLNLKINNTRSNLFVKLSDIFISDNKKTKLSFVYKKIENKEQNIFFYKLKHLKYKKMDLLKLKNFPFLKHLELLKADTQ